MDGQTRLGDPGQMAKPYLRQEENDILVVRKTLTSHTSVPAGYGGRETGNFRDLSQAAPGWSLTPRSETRVGFPARTLLVDNSVEDGRPVFQVFKDASLPTERLLSTLLV